MRVALLAALAVVLAGCAAPAATSPVQQASLPYAPLAGAAERFDAAGARLTLPAQLPVAHMQRTGHSGSEPSIGIMAKGAIFVTGSDETLRSRDGGATWETAYDFHVQVGPVPVRFTADPMMAVDGATGRVFVDHNYPVLVCTDLLWSDDEGASWTDRPGACTLPVIDFQKLAAGKPGPDLNPLANVTYPDVLYLCHDKNAFVSGVAVLVGDTDCAMSYDGGLTWPMERQVATSPPQPCGGVVGFPAMGPDGTVVVPVGNGCDTWYGAVSRDSGLTWDLRKGPGNVGSTSTTTAAAFTDDGTLYALWLGNDNLPYLARSGDVGKTWAGPWRVAPPGVTAAFFSQVQAGAPGRVAMAFLSTRDAADPAKAPDGARWYLTIVTSGDAQTDHPTFTAVTSSPADDPVQVGKAVPPNRNLGDFLGSAVGPDGRFYVAHGLGCASPCGGSTTQSKDAVIAVSSLAGWSLRGAT